MAHFAENWQKVTNNKWVLSLVKTGYRIPFIERPPLSVDPIFFQQSLSPQLEEEVASLLQKGAVEEIHPVSPGFYSRIFLVPKKNGKVRLIIDLSTLNRHVFIQSFKMETQRKVRNAINLNDWAFSLDLTDAYLHVRIHPRSRKYLRFTLNGRVYHFKALPFGLSTSPFVFTLLMTVIATHLRKRAIIMHPYLDDWLSRNQNRQTLLEHRHYIMYLITSLGLIINYQKSDLIPTQIFSFIGMEFLTYSNIVRVPHPRVQKLLETIMIIYQKTFISARVFLSLLGQLSAAADFVMLGRLHLRPLQMSLLSQWRPQKIFTESPNQDISEHFTPSRLVEAGRDLSTRSALEDKSPLTHNIYGRQPVGLGFTCGTGRTTVSWSLDGNPISASHKYAGNDGHFNGTKGSSSHNQEFHCVSLHRQHNSSGLSEKTRGDPFSRPLFRSLGNPELVLPEQDSASRKTRSGEIQHSGRQALKSKQTNLDRVVSEPRSSKCSTSHDSVSQHRLVCDTSESQASTICVSNTRSKGPINRCSIDELESHSRLRFSSVSSHSCIDQQNTSVSVQNSIDSSFLAQQIMVPRTSESAGVSTNNPPCNSKSIRTITRKVQASKHRYAAASRLGIIKQSIRDKKFSEQVADHVSKARRKSTGKVYDAKWKIFVNWANQRKVDPIQASPHVIADFLTFLFTEKKCQVSTIKGYRSTISNTLKFKAGYDIGSHPVPSELIKSFQRQRPVERSLAPKWDLAFALMHLCKTPFEPLSKASLLHLSMKTAFLITMATARRVSEVHAFSIDKDHFRFSNLDGSLTLRTKIGFLAKNQLPSRAPDSINIPKLSNFCHTNDSFNMKLCPIRALKIYLKRTKSIRKGRDRLFIPTRGDHDLHKSTISKWVKFTIKNAYNSISSSQSRLLKIKPHELRALSTSWAYLNFIPMEEIIKAAVWSSSSLFASHYLRDFKNQSVNLHKVGPLVVAQKVTGGSTNQAPPEED